MLRRARLTALSSLIAICALGLVAASAEAIASSRVTTPAGTIYPLVSEGSDITIAGTVSPGTSQVDLRCYHTGTEYAVIDENVPVISEAFTAEVPRFKFDEDELCRLRAVPHGNTESLPPGEETEFRGPLVAPSQFEFSPTGSSTSLSSLSGYAFITEAEHCGLETHLVGPVTLERTKYLFFCNGGIASSLPSEKLATPVIDGSIAYGPSEAANVEKEAKAKATYAGSPQVTITSKSFNEANGQTTYTEQVPFVRCVPEANVQPTETSCSSFAPTGVTLERTWTTNDALAVISMLDVWRSTDGKAHEVAVNYYNEFEQEQAGGLGVFEFPGTSAFAGTTPAETVTLPSGAGTIFYRYDSAAPETGSEVDPQGAIVYDRAPSSPLVVITPTSEMQTEVVYEAPYKFAVPAGGTSVLRMTFLTGFGLPEIRAEAAAALAGYAPTISLAAPANGATIETESSNVAVAGAASDSGALASVTVNGSPVTLGAGGAFATSVPLVPGTNTITATATDQAGLTRSASVTVTRKLPPPKAALVGAITTDKGNVSFELACKGAQGTFCSVKDSLTTIERRSHSRLIGLLARITKKQVTVSSGTQVILPGKEMRVTLKLNSTGKALLKQFHKLPVHLTVTIAETPKATTALARNLTVTPAKRAKRRKRKR